MAALGDIYYVQVRKLDGLWAHQRTLTGRVLLFGEEHEDTLNSVKDVSIMFRDLGQPRRAIALLQKRVETATKILSEDPYVILLPSIFELANLYTELGHFQKVIRLVT